MPLYLISKQLIELCQTAGNKVTSRERSVRMILRNTQWSELTSLVLALGCVKGGKSVLNESHNLSFKRLKLYWIGLFQLF